MKHLVDSDVFFSAIHAGHVSHRRSRDWLDRVKPDGWGVAVETYLSAMRLLMNTSVMGKNTHTAPAAMDAIERELAGTHPGRVVFSIEKPDRAILGLASGHKQVMDFWLVQLAKQAGCSLATNDAGTLANWPGVTVGI
ncbi:MAG: VapC toxin family PIN domain ribonuclease [Opitutaceae bacterium]|jgi:predicted nucleic acid-binding protein|nr:VapC toxin family PIN domain ribonuclease [Opitutaceae bacterium]